MIIHLVYFKIKKVPEIKDPEEAKQKIIDSLKDVPGPLEPWRFRFSPPASDVRAKGFDFGFVAYFKDFAALKEYADSEAHQSAVNNVILNQIDDAMDYDIEVPDGTPV